MGLRPRSIRTRIFLLVLVPVLSLIGLYAFATVLTARSAIVLSRSTTLKNATGEPVGAFLGQLDRERPLALVYLSSPTAANLAALELQETKTAAAAAALSTALHSSATMDNATAEGKQAFATLLSAAAGLPALRAQIRAQIITRPQAFAAYNTLVADGYTVLNQVILEQTNATLVTQALAFVRMGKSEEMLLRESAIVSSDLAAGSFPTADRQQVAELAGRAGELFSQTLPDLLPLYRGYYQRDISSQAAAALVGQENAVIGDTSASGPPPVSPQSSGGRRSVRRPPGCRWPGTQALERAHPAGARQLQSTYLDSILAGGLGLLAVALSVFVSIWIGRGLVRELAALRQSALELAEKRLPDVVRRLAAGQDVDVAAEAPELPLPPMRSARSGRPSPQCSRTAVEAAVGQARLRQGISDIFRNLARRSQSLLHRQLALLDAMERRAREPEELKNLFRIDHLTTRMRRHAESLIILSGDAPARAWRNPVPFVDVLRAAVAEVEDYTRIKVTATTRAAIIGPAVGDVIHMIAELAENAVDLLPAEHPGADQRDVVGTRFRGGNRGPRSRAERGEAGRARRAAGEPAAVRPVRQRPARPVRGEPAGQASTASGSRCAPRRTAGRPRSSSSRSSWSCQKTPTRTAHLLAVQPQPADRQARGP